jgi:superfamily II DNA or RNA helicase
MGAPLHYHISFKRDLLVVRLEEAGSRRILYYDTLKALAKNSDQEVLLFLIKMHTRFRKISETLSFQSIDIDLTDALQAFSLLSQTGRVFYQSQPLHCDWSMKRKLYWKGRQDTFSAYISYQDTEIPIETCEKFFSSWCIWNKMAFPIESSLGWRWVEMFLKGPILLEGVKKKRFLEEEPPILWGEENTTPQLFLTDLTGCFANLGKDSQFLEKDLLEAGFLRKTVGNSHYFCPSDRFHSTLLFLLELGWEIFDFQGRRFFRQTASHWDVKEEEGEIAIQGSIEFQNKKVSLRSFFETSQKPGKWSIEIDSSSVGLLDLKKGKTFKGNWIGETLRIKKEAAASLISLLDEPSIIWEESILKLAKGLQQGASLETSLPGSSFQGELLEHQQRGLNWLTFLYAWGFSALLADEMGLGKTVQVLAFFSRLRTNLPVLIVAPTSLIYNWRSEIDRFLNHPSIYLHVGPDRLKQPTDFQKHPFVITSYAILRLDEEILSKVDWEVIVLDESGAIKTATTQTAQAAYKLKGRFRICLNGTPIENRASELWSQMRFCLPHLAESQMEKSIRPFILRRKKDELDLPEKIEQSIWLQMNEEQSNLYHSYLEGIQSNLLKKVEVDGASSHRMEILEAILRLRQICIDPRLLGYEIEGVKLQAIFSDIQEVLSEKRKVLVYSQFTSVLQLLAKEISSDVLYIDGSINPKERAERVRRFQEDETASLFLLSLKAGGVGLNLTAADYVFLIDPWWNEAVETQAIDRAHRIGRKKSVIAKKYLTLNSIEEKMVSLKSKKVEVAEALLDQKTDFNWTEEDLLHLLS